MINRAEYDTFGNITFDSDETFKVPFGFAGRLHDRDTGLVRFGCRDYDPETGRWTAKDPIRFAGVPLRFMKKMQYYAACQCGHTADAEQVECSHKFV